MKKTLDELAYNIDEEELDEDSKTFEITMKRDKFFSLKDGGLETGIAIVKAIETNFTKMERNKVDCQIVFESFRECHMKMRQLLRKEMEFINALAEECIDGNFL